MQQFSFYKPSLPTGRQVTLPNTSSGQALKGEPELIEQNYISWLSGELKPTKAEQS